MPTSPRLPRSMQQITALTAVLAAGCGPLASESELDLARQEAPSLTLQMFASAGFAFGSALDYGLRATDAQRADLVGATPSADGCEGLQIADPVADDGVGIVEFDLSPCSGSSGVVEVEQQLSGDAELSPADRIDSAPTTVRFADSAFSSAEVRGSFHLGNGAEAGSVTTTVDVAFGDLQGRLDVKGTFAPSASGVGTDFDADGYFVSDSDLRWRTSFGHVAFAESCGEALGGEVLGWFRNDAGEALVRIEFDDQCDGCATLFVDGEAPRQWCWD